jgi:hypothetical protein
VSYWSGTMLQFPKRKNWSVTGMSTVGGILTICWRVEMINRIFGMKRSAKFELSLRRSVASIEACLFTNYIVVFRASQTLYTTVESSGRHSPLKHAATNATTLLWTTFSSSGSLFPAQLDPEHPRITMMVVCIESKTDISFNITTHSFASCDRV